MDVIESQNSGKFQFAIDRGGTFTDVYARCPDGQVKVMKLLSEDPANYDDAPREGIRRILQEVTGKALDLNGKVDTSQIEWIRMGTTVATNALLERKGERMALVINKGFKDLLFIGNQARPSIFKLDIKTPDVLYEKVVEIDCRVMPALPGKCQLEKDPENLFKGTTGEDMYVVKDLDEEAVKEELSELKASGIVSIGVVLAHSYTAPDHELRIGQVAKDLGFRQISLSHQVMPMVRMVPRGFTACADAYLTPHIHRYLQSFAGGFTDGLAGCNVLFMQSDGGLTPMHSFSGSRAVLSGPAGGVVGYAVTTRAERPDEPVIGFDMGGTSTDVSRFAGSYEHVCESTTAGVTIQAPQLDINTVAAGGGSMLFFRSGLFVVGPESAGAHPGPACYQKGGPLTVTDANLALGRLLPEYFPKIFGADNKSALDKQVTTSRFDQLTREINQFLRSQAGAEPMTLEEVAMGFIRVANEAMCRPIRALTQGKGYDTARHTLACFGGAGGQHACSVARALGMSAVFVHRYAGVLSAYGLALADVVHEEQEPCAARFSGARPDAPLEARLDALAERCRRGLRAQGFPDEHVALERFLHMRYEGTDCALMVGPGGDYRQQFLDRYTREFGFTIPDRDIVVDDLRVRAVGRSAPAREQPRPAATHDPRPEKAARVYFEGGYRDASVFVLDALRPGHVVAGPAVVMDRLSTVLVEPGCSAAVTARGDLLISVGRQEARAPRPAGAPPDAVQLSIFGHRFMSIAEQMGRVLQRTSISTNIKERLDFSCALFGPDGGLVSNAPHIPVHLGAMQETVRYQLRARDRFRPGDVLLSNHPAAGGSHLPDLTVVTPVFHRADPQPDEHTKPIFFVASRGHHADIGGITPGSMPPNSTSLDQEGATFKSFLLVEGGRFREAAVTEELMRPGLVPGSSGTRNLADNLSDLKAQVAANQKGIALMGELIAEYGLRAVQEYMGHIQANAELAVRELLRRVAADTLRRSGRLQLRAQDHMDDGTAIRLLVTLDPRRGAAVCDFTGTGCQVWGNCNAPRAVTLSALIYCLRCMLGHDVPLNQGCLAPVSVVIPDGSILSPRDGAAVVGGNVLTSQRVVDVIFRAFGACAASQGCMNNVTFGTESWGNYETVAGGSGAGPGWHGRAGVHTHMTNTRITDLEVLERRYPVLVRRFGLRAGSGGRGRFRGGDGVVRELLFRAPVTLSVLTERRALRPFGLAGGGPGARGLNLLLRRSGARLNLGAKTAVPLLAGDVFQLHTPGGGGYGSPDEEEPAAQTAGSTVAFTERGSLYEYRRAQESA